MDVGCVPCVGSVRSRSGQGNALRPFSGFRPAGHTMVVCAKGELMLSVEDIDGLLEISGRA